VRVPKTRARSDSERALTALYQRIAALPRDVSAEPELTRVHAALDAAYPREWLLRWNLLERARDFPEGRALAQRISAELETLEVAFDRREPIAMGLRFLSERP
jgi:hypothetical protein